MMRRYREAEVKPEVPVMDPVAAAHVNPLEAPARMSPSPTSSSPRPRPAAASAPAFPPLFFKNKRR